MQKCEAAKAIGFRMYFLYYICVYDFFSILVRKLACCLLTSRANIMLILFFEIKMSFAMTLIRNKLY